MGAKRKTKKSTRPISLFLAMLLVATMVPVFAFASDTEEAITAQGSEQSTEGSEEGAGAGIDGETGESADAGNGSTPGTGPDTEAGDGSGETDSGHPENTSHDSDGSGGYDGSSGDPSETSPSTALETPVIVPLGNEIQPLATTYLTARIHDDTGWKPITDGSGDTASISYNGTASRVYDVEVSLAGMPDGPTKVLDIALPVGMAWNNNGYSGNIPSMLVAEPVKTTSSLNPASDGGQNFAGGTMTYTVKGSITALVLEIKVAADSKVAATHIANALTASLTIGETVERVALETISVSYTPTVALFNANSYESAIRLNESYKVANNTAGVVLRLSTNGAAASRLISGVEALIHLDDARAVLTLESAAAAAGWTIADQGNGDYVVTYKGPTIHEYYLTVPLEITCPQPPATGASWKSGEAVSLTIEDTELTYASYPGVTVSVPQAASGMDIFARVFRVAPAGEKVFVGFPTISSAMAATETHADNTLSSYLQPLDEESGRIGYYTVGNAGSDDSVPKTVKITFDTTNARVMALQLPVPQGQTVSSIKVNGVQRAVDFVGDRNNRILVTYAMLGLSRSVAIASLEYDLESIPAISFMGGVTGSRSATLGYYGTRLTSEPATSTVEIVDQQAGGITSGVSKTSVTWPPKTYARTCFETTSPQQTHTAGSKIPMSVTFTGTTSPYMTENPVIYLRIEAVDETGTPLEVSDIHLDNGASRGSQDITSDLVISDEIVSDAGKQVRIITLDTRNITDGSVFLGGDYVTATNVVPTTLQLSYTINSTLRTPGGSFYYGDMVFIGDPAATTLDTNAASLTDLTNSARATELGAVGTLAGLTGTLANNYYKIAEMSSIIVETFIKKKSESTYTQWLQDSDPVDVGSLETTSVQVKERITNNSGVDVKGPVDLYIPIPQVGDNWGSLADSTEFSLRLTGAVSAPVGVGGSYIISYGEGIAASDNGLTLRGADWKAAPSDWSKVNCIRILASDVPEGEVADFVLDLVADTSQTDISSNRINQWNAYYFQSLINSKGQRFDGWFHGSPIGLKALLGSVKGQLFLDENANNSLDAGEELSEVWDIAVYHKDDLTTPLRTVQTAADGSYQVEYLLEGEGNYQFVVENSSAAYRFCDVVATSEGNQFAGNANHTIGTAVISPLIPDSSGTVLSIANIGVKANLTALTFKSQDTSRGTINGADAQGVVILKGSASDTITGAPGVTALTGYTHSGWSKTDTGAADPLLGLSGPFGSAGLYGWIDTTYWATFDTNTYSIFFDRNDTTGLITSATQTNRHIGDTITVPANQTRQGYTFLGWSLSPTASQADTDYTATTTGFTLDAARIDALYANDTKKEVTLYAVWIANRTLTYYGNGNTGGVAPASVTATQGSYVTVSGQGSLVRSGYTFSGWATSATGPVIYGANASLQLLSNVSLYAVWTAVPVPPVSTYSVLYAPGGDNVIGLPANQSGLTQGTTVVVGGVPSRIGYNFTGWMSSRGGVYQAGSSFTMPASNVVLTASWAPLVFTITFVDGQGNTLKTETVGYGGTVLPPTDPTRSGFRFVGWDRDASAWTNVRADATITARWDDETFTVTPGITTTDPTPPPTGGQEGLNEAAAEQGIPSIGVPLAAPVGFAAWALLNLILMIIGVILALVFTIIRFMRKKDDEDAEENEKQPEPGVRYDTPAEERQDKIHRRRAIGWLLGMIVLAVCGVILFILTEDITLPMVWVDIWTILQAIVLIATLIIGTVAVSRKKREKEEDEDTAQETA